MKTEFLPEPWLDETIPERGDHPDVFLHSSDGQWYFRPVEDGEDKDQPEYWTALTPGQVVPFCEFRDHGQWTITISRDGDGRPIWSGGEAVMNAFMLIIVTPIIAFYMLLDWPRFTQTIDAWLPRRHDDTIRRLWREMDHSIAGFLRGQTIVVVMLATFYIVSLELIGLNYGALIGATAGLLSFVPLVGAVTGFIISGMVATVQFWPEWWMIALTLGVFVFGQFVEGYVIAPKIVGEATGVHPVWLMFALFAFGFLFGFVGLLLAAPLAAIIAVLVRFARDKYLESSLYLEIETEDDTFP